MKKLLCSLIVVLAACNVQAQLLLQQGFNAKSTWPAGYKRTVVSNGTAGTAPDTATSWSIQPYGGYYDNSSLITIHPFSGNGMARFNSYLLPSGTVVKFETPEINLALLNAGAIAEVSFWMFRDPGYNAALDNLSVAWLGSNTNRADTLISVMRNVSQRPVALSEGWFQYSCTLPLTAITQGRGRLVFTGFGNWGGDIYVDELVVKGVNPPCPIASFPYFENFDRQLKGELPCGYTNIDLESGYDTSFTTDDEAGLSRPNSLVSANLDNHSPENKFVMLPAMQLQAGKTYTFSLRYRADTLPNGQPGREAFNFVVGNTANINGGNCGQLGVLKPMFVGNLGWLADSAQFVPAASGTYYFGLNRVTSSANSRGLILDDFRITERCITPAPQITAVTNTVACARQTVTLSSSATHGNRWTNGDTTQTITVDSTGNYAVQVIAAGCTSLVSAAVPVTINPLPPTPNISVNSNVIQADANASSYAWLYSPEGTDMQPIAGNGNNQAQLLVTNSGCYAAIAVSDGGCLSDTSTMMCVVSTRPRGGFTLSIAPNPCKDVLKMRITLGNALPANLHIYSTDGRLMIQDKVAPVNGFFIKSVDVGQLPPGIYLLQLSNEIAMGSELFVKE